MRWRCCLANSPVNHLNVDHHPERAKSGNGTSVTDLVGRFLLDTCRATGECLASASPATPDLVPFDIASLSSVAAQLDRFSGPILVPTVVPRAWKETRASSFTTANGYSYDLVIAPPLGHPARSDANYSHGGFITGQVAGPAGTCAPGGGIECDVLHARGTSIRLSRTDAGWGYGWRECGMNFGVSDNAHIPLTEMKQVIDGLQLLPGRAKPNC
jgi:hypothetical protein